MTFNEDYGTSWHAIIKKKIEGGKILQWSVDNKFNINKNIIRDLYPESKCTRTEVERQNLRLRFTVWSKMHVVIKL